MRSNILKTIIIVFALVSFSQCETEIDLLDDWQDIPVVYGLLNQEDDIHYIRINRAFLGEGNAIHMASDLDSIIYNPNDLDVVIKEYSGSNLIREIPLDTMMVHNVDSGVFSYPDQMIYRTTASSVKLSEDYTYRLEIFNKKRNKYIESETNLIHNLSIKRPLAGQTLVNYTSKFPAEVIWRTAKNGRLYQLSIRIFYSNYYNNGSSEQHTLNWNFPSRTASTLNGGEEMSMEVFGEQFYIFLENNIPQTNASERTLDSVQYIVSAANDNFNTYMKVNEPSNSIIQERPEFSNISNGIGLFASRYYQTRTLLLNSDSQDSLVDGSHTRHLNFVKPIP
ncbi:MAG: hypothetical protein R6T91_10050 [Bacteroidales bacterium]